MKKQILIATLLSLTTAAAGTNAVAKPGAGPERHKPTFEQLDTDSDGQLSTAELEAMGKKRFDEVDVNGDGLLSAEEMIAHQQARIADRSARMIEKFDKDGDGLLSAEEMPQRKGPHKLLQKADTDGNGSISKAEFDTAQAIIDAVMKKKHHLGGHEGRGHGPDSE